MQPVLKTTDYATLNQLFKAIGRVVVGVTALTGKPRPDSVVIWSPEPVSTLFPDLDSLHLLDIYAHRLDIKVILSAAADSRLRAWGRQLGWTTLWEIPALDEMNARLSQRQARRAASSGATLTVEAQQVLTHKLNQLTPTLIEETVEIFRQDPALTDRYGYSLPDVARDEVVRLRDLLLTALELNYPQLLGKELRWFEEMCFYHNFSMETVCSYLRHYRARLEEELEPHSRTAALAVFDNAVRQMRYVHCF